MICIYHKQKRLFLKNRKAKKNGAPTNGDSGSPLFMKKNEKNYSIIGILSHYSERNDSDHIHIKSTWSRIDEQFLLLLNKIFLNKKYKKSTLKNMTSVSKKYMLDAIGKSWDDVVNELYLNKEVQYGIAIWNDVNFYNEKSIFWAEKSAIQGNRDAMQLLAELVSPVLSIKKIEKNHWNGIKKLLSLDVQNQAIKLLKYIGLRVLIIDEIHHILAGNLNRQRAFLNVLKYLGNELQVSIVAVGTRDAFRALQTDPQLANRFEPALLPRWEFDTDFLRLLASFERMLPLHEPSELHDTSVATKLFSMSEVYIGELSRLLASAAECAIQTGRERIDVLVLDKIDWVSPSERRRQINLRG